MTQEAHLEECPISHVDAKHNAAGKDEEAEQTNRSSSTEEALPMACATCQRPVCAPPGATDQVSTVRRHCRDAPADRMRTWDSQDCDFHELPKQ